jgi:hypothetical protein
MLYFSIIPTLSYTTVAGKGALGEILLVLLQNKKKAPDKIGRFNIKDI